MINLNKVSEGIDYEIVSENSDESKWAVQVLRGNFVGVGFVYDEVSINGERGEISFKLTALDIQTNQPAELEDEEKAQYFAADILEDIIKNGIANGSVVLNGQDKDK